MRSFSRLLTVAIATSFLVSSAAFAAGFGLYEQGAKATGMAGAFGATADDPTAIFFNVAGIAQQRQMAFNTGATAITFANEFRGDPNDVFASGQYGEYVHHTFVPAHFYGIVPIGQQMTFGLGVFTPFGLRTNWADPWAGRFISRDANVKTVSVEPAIAWQTTDGRLAIGAGAEYRRSHIILDRNNPAFNPFTQRIFDALNAHLNSDWDSAWGWNVGILFKPSPTWRLGASYRADMTIDYKGEAVFTQIPSGNAIVDAGVKAQLPPNQKINTSINYPATAIVGVAHTMGAWDIEGDVTHTSWSRFKELAVNFETTPALSFVRPQNWEDTFSYRLGTNGRVATHWDVRMGLIYDENPQPTEGVGPLLPDSDRTALCFGVGWHNGPFTVDLAEMVLHFKRRSTNGLSPEFNGTYKTDANLIGINLGYKF